MEEYQIEVLERLRRGYDGIYDKCYLTYEYEYPELSFRFKSTCGKDGYVSVRGISGRRFYVSVQAGDLHDSGMYTTYYGNDSSLRDADGIRNTIARILVFVDTLS